MVRYGLAILLCCPPLFAGPGPRLALEGQEAKIEALRRSPVAAAATAPKTIAVDCTKGQSLQAAIDKNAGPITIEVTGVCVENVVINHQDVTLRGAGSGDGIQSPSTLPALTIRNVDAARLENLAFSDNPGPAVSIVASAVLMIDCLISGNNVSSGPGTVAIGAANDSLLDATNLTVSDNHRAGVSVSRGSRFFCHGCAFSGNVGLAAVASDGALVSLLNSTVAQRFGLRAIRGAYADIDCITEPSPHPCAMQATGVAGQAFDHGVVWMWGAGDFTGQLTATESGTIGLYGARQIAGAQPGQGPPTNDGAMFGKVVAVATFDTDPPRQSRLLATGLSHFSRLVVTDETEISGAFDCSSAADAWLDGSVVAAPGTTVTGCEHATLP
jgi:hypothetical protein